MRPSFRQTAIATTAIIGLSTFAAAAAPLPATGNPTVVRASATSAQTTHAMDTKIEQRIADLHAKLQISAAEQPQWDQFAQVMRDNARTMNQTFQQRVHTLPAMTATDNMQSYAQIATEHAQEMQKLVPAFEALYASMPDSQQRVADKVFRDDAHTARHG
jgi:D-alanyl-D-alanine carboxypeptidase